MNIDHIGIVVRDIKSAIDYWETVFEYKQMTEIVENSRQKVKVVFMSKDDSIVIKLITPTSKESPAFDSLKKGGGLHHLCFKCDALDSSVEKLRNKGLRMLAEPQPGEAFDNNEIAFMYARNNLNIELIDTDIKAKKLINY